MPRSLMRLLSAAALAAVLYAPSLTAQASPFVPLDDPMLPQVEHLILRGDLRDPSPMVRPFRREDIRRSLASADSTNAAVVALRSWYAEPESIGAAESLDAVRYAVAGRVGTQAATQARRDLLHPAGEGGLWPLADVRLEALWGPVALVTRPGIENRVKDDPDWPGRRDNLVSGRLFEGYASVQHGPARLTFGQLERNWGPVGLPGIGISNTTYRRDGLSLEFMTRKLQFTSYATQLADENDSTGALVKRYFIVKRLGLQVSPRLQLAAWEATVIQGRGRSFESAYANPFALVFTTFTNGYGDSGTNNMLGAEVTWRAFGRSTLQGQFALDDFWYDQRNVTRDRFAATAMLTGPLGKRLSYRTTYSVVSSLALRAFVPQENFSDGGVGLGRNFTDNEQFSLHVGVPIKSQWLLTPELTRFQQGEGTITAPYPALPADPSRFPTLFIGTVQTTYRAALGVSGRSGAVQVLGNMGLHRVINDGNVAGRNRNRVEARLQVMVGAGTGGVLR